MPHVTKGTWVAALYSSFWQQEAGACLTPVMKTWLLRAPGCDKGWRKGPYGFLRRWEGGRGKQALAWLGSAVSACSTSQDTWAAAGGIVRSCMNGPTTNSCLGFQCKEGAGQELHLSARFPSSNPKQYLFISVCSWRYSLTWVGCFYRAGASVLSRGSWHEQQPWYPRVTAWLDAAGILTPFDAGWCFRKELRASCQI